MRRTVISPLDLLVIFGTGGIAGYVSALLGGIWALVFAVILLAISVVTLIAVIAEARWGKPRP